LEGFGEFGAVLEVRLPSDWIISVDKTGLLRVFKVREVI